MRTMSHEGLFWHNVSGRLPSKMTVSWHFRRTKLGAGMPQENPKGPLGYVRPLRLTNCRDASLPGILRFCRSKEDVMQPTRSLPKLGCQDRAGCRLWIKRAACSAVFCTMVGASNLLPAGIEAK